MTRSSLRRAVLLATLLAASAAGSARAQDGGPLTVLDVPFLAQSEQLCGGAAAAMVLRYWGGTAHAEEFAGLVDPDAGGIEGAALVGAVRARGWQAVSLRGTEALARAHLARGRPLVTLVEDRPGRYHYVVPVAWDEGTVLLHDPTEGPFVVRDAEAFTRAWAAAGFWTMLVLPDEATPPPARVAGPAVAGPVVTGDGDTCDGLVPRAVALARAGDHDGAAAVLAEAVRRCPASAAVTRERAALRFVDRDWSGAAALAAEAVARTPGDAHAWRVLAASRFLLDDRDGALEAWNAAGEPRVDRVRLDLYGPTTALTVREAAGLRPGDLLTPDALRLAGRRVRQLPAVANARVGYVPGREGRADLDVAVRDRGGALSPAALAGNGVRALTTHEVRLAQPFAGGALVRAGVRWQTGRPRVAVGVEMPRLLGRPGVWQVEAAWERQAYASGVRDVHRAASVGYRAWVAPDTGVEAGLGVERWAAAGTYLTIGGALDQRAAGDRVAVRLGASVSPALSQGAAFARGGLTLAWRASAGTDLPGLAARAGVDVATAGAPPDAWPRAGTGRATGVLMRAHPLLVDGVVGGPLLGRRLAHAGVEATAPLGGPAPLGLGLAVFADAGRAWDGLDTSTPRRVQVDVGIGLALRVAGTGQALRVDLARGLADGTHALTVRWQPPWPGGSPAR